MTITIVKMIWHSTCKPYSCDKLAQGNYKWRHDNVAGTVPYKLCGKFRQNREVVVYDLETVAEKELVKML